MKSNEALERALHLLIIHRRICADHHRHRNQTLVDMAERHASISGHKLAIAQHRLAVIESLARIRQMLPPKPVDNVQCIVERERQTLARLHAKASIRQAADRHLRAQARQAAFDRTLFISEMQQNVPQEMWDEALQEYDRRLYESREEGE